MEPAQHIAKARRLLAGGRHMLSGEFSEAAGREAYLSAYHAALAYILLQTGKRPATHKGGRTEFSRLAREDPRIDQAHVSFLGFAYDLKELADYDELMPVSLDKAQRALLDATRMVDDIAAIVDSL